MISLPHKKIGIWGFGLVGKSALSYATGQGAQCSIFDQRELTSDEKELITKQRATINKDLNDFLTYNDYILTSPGVDITPYKNDYPFICELDLFSSTWHKPSIAITGSIGKTTITSLISALVTKKIAAVTAGNIGTPMLSILDQQDKVMIAILELSSWQLEYADHYSPDIAIITNLYPNHLDRHKTMTNYFQAKAHIFKHQQKHQTLIAPLDLREQITSTSIQSNCIWVNRTKPNEQLLDQLTTAIYIDNDQVIHYYDNLEHKIMHCSELPQCTIQENWLFVLATLIQLQLPVESITDCYLQLEHRIERVATHHNITFYNDSKGTTIEATLAALSQFQQEKIILFLGGLSKGVDRSKLIKQMPDNVIDIICFGQEANNLKHYCDLEQRNAHAFTNLEEAFVYALSSTQDASIGLLSPSGSSYDLYNNYEERGKHFKQLVHAAIASHKIDNNC